MIETDLGCVTAYADAVAQGYTGTRKEFGQVLANFADSATQVAADRTAVEAAKKSVEVMQSDVTQKQETAASNMKTAVEAAEKAKQSASNAEASKQAAAKSEQNINNTVTAFDSHVEEKKSEADTAINKTKDAAVKAVTDQQTASIQEAKSQIASYITEKESVAEDQINKHTSDKITELNKAASTAKTALEQSISNSEKAKTALDGSITNSVTSKNNLDKSIETSAGKKSDLDTSIKNADTAKTALEQSISNSEKAKTALDGSITNSVTSKNNLDKSIETSAGKKSDLDTSIKNADTAKTALDTATITGNNALQALQSENSSAASNLEELRGENFNSQEILAGVADLRAYLGLSDDDILGLQVDYRNKTFKRLAGATNLTPGTDFDRFSMYGGRRKCNVADDGTISAWFGDESYAEDGSNGQVMVYQPKFYYLVCPVVYDPIDTGIGYHLRKANYYVSEKPRPGFRLHPAFYDVNGNEIDYFLTSADEGSVYDVSASAYLLQDEQVLNAAEDKFCSISGARPASGYSQNLTRTSVEQLAQNRGTNWHGDLIKQVSAEQLLMIIEMGVMELQTPIGLGVVNIPWETGDNKTCSYAAVTGSTSSIGNGTGRAAKSTVYPSNVATEYTDNGKTSICWRGKENFWGNIWKFVYGVNIWGNGKMAGGQPYICKDFNFAENKNSDNYEAAGFTVAAKAGYISAMGYSTKCDWLFMASECLGNSALPVGDYTYITELLNGYRIARLGGHWDGGVYAGPFYWALNAGVGNRARNIGGRLVYIPTKDSDVYLAAIASWKAQMAAA